MEKGIRRRPGERGAAPSGGALRGRGLNEILQGLIEAARLIVTFDGDLFEIAARSLEVTVTAVIIASAIGLPVGAWIAVNRFRWRRHAIAVLNALMGLPPVVVGLVVYLLLSRSGPSASWIFSSRPRR